MLGPIAPIGLNPLGQVQLANWAQYVNSLAPVAWYRFRETSGTNAANSGSGGSSLDMTITSTTLNQAGKLGSSEAFLCDGTNSRLQTANNAALAALTTWEYIFLINPSSAGESLVGTFFSWGNASFEPFSEFNGALTSLRVRVSNTTPSNADAITTTGLSTSTWQLLFMAFDNAGDRKVHIYKGVSGAVTEYTYSAQPALTGTYKTPTSALNLFNWSDQTRTFAGLADEVIIYSGNLTAAQRLRLVQLSGV